MAMPRRPRTARTRRTRRDPTGTARLLLVVAVTALLLRTFVVAPFGIPSESMLPLLQIGDDLLVAKWRYGWSRHSFPWSLAPFSGRLFGRDPRRGDVVVFKNPADGRTDYIKRVIGLPGDRVGMRRGTLILNGTAVPHLRVADLLVPVSRHSPCRPEGHLAITLERGEHGEAVCRYPRYRETLPGGRSYDVIDLGPVPAADDVPTVLVPPGRYFLMGDNRDRSADSRFPPAIGGGIGMVPAENIVGRATILFFATDGDGEWLKPWTWLATIRPDRIGERL